MIENLTVSAAVEYEGDSLLMLSWSFGVDGRSKSVSTSFSRADSGDWIATANPTTKNNNVEGRNNT